MWLHQEEIKIQREQFLFFCFSKQALLQLYLLVGLICYFIFYLEHENHVCCKINNDVPYELFLELPNFGPDPPQRWNCFDLRAFHQISRMTLSALYICVAEVQQLAGTHDFSHVKLPLFTTYLFLCLNNCGLSRLCLWKMQNSGGSRSKLWPVSPSF